MKYEGIVRNAKQGGQSMRKRVIAFVIMLVLMISIVPTSVFAEGSTVTTERRDGVLYVLNQDGSAAKEGWQQLDEYSWCYVESGGKAAIGWKNVGGKWYYFSEASGIMLKGLQLIDGKYYVFSIESGAMLTNAWYEDRNGWVYTGGSGALVSGWREINGKWYYFTGSSGRLSMGESLYFMNLNEGMSIYAYGYDAPPIPYAVIGKAVAIGKELHTFDESGAWTGQITSKGWNEIGSDWYYIDENGAPAVGWKEISGKWYHFCDKENDSRGKMRSGVVDVDGIKWFLEDSGALREKAGWASKAISGTYGTETRVDTYWLYLNSNGSCKTGWVKDAGKWYYINPSYAIMVTGIREIDGKYYLLKEDGALAEGSGWTQLKELDNEWCYINGDGSLRTGWISDGGKWYYIGHATSGYSGVGAGSAGVGILGATLRPQEVTMMRDKTLCNIDGKRYAFNADGSMRTGWIQEGDYWYYYGADGALYTNGTYTIGGTSYTFDMYGRMQ